MSGYWSRVHRRAMQQTLHALSLDTSQRIVSKLAIALIGAAVVAYVVGGDTSRSKIVAGIGTVCAMGLVFLGLYAWNFINVPPKLDEEVRKAQGTLQAQLNQRKERAQKIKLLAELLSVSEQLRVRKIENQEQYEQWVRDVNAWLEKAQNSIRDAVSDAAASTFIQKPQIWKAFISGTFNDSHANNLQYLNEYAKRLSTIIDRHDPANQATN